MTRRKLILDTARKLALDFTAYNRKNDKELPQGTIEEALAAGEVSVDEIVLIFTTALRQELGTS